MTDSGSLKSAFGDNRPFKGYYVVRSHAPDAAAYDTVSELPLDEAIEKCVEKEPGRGLEVAAEDGTRDAANYMHHRLETEDWLRENAAENGVSIDRHNPVYFAFTDKPEEVMTRMAEMRPDNEVVCFAAEKLDLSNWSFTMDDHFFPDIRGGIASDQGGHKGHPLHGQVMNAEQLVEAINEYGFPEDGGSHNIEAQMWTRQPASIVPDMTLTSSSYVPVKHNI